MIDSKSDSTGEMLRFLNAQHITFSTNPKVMWYINYGLLPYYLTHIVRLPIMPNHSHLKRTCNLKKECRKKVLVIQ